MVGVIPSQYSLQSKGIMFMDWGVIPSLYSLQSEGNTIGVWG
jgi:hypothetical protein